MIGISLIKSKLLIALLAVVAAVVGVYSVQARRESRLDQEQKQFDQPITQAQRDALGTVTGKKNYIPK